MNRNWMVAACALLATFAAGCAELQIYTSPDLSAPTRTGIPFYVSKPYLLVSRTGAKDKPVEVSVVYIPDLAHPYYARIVPGIGSSETSLAFSNSILTTVGQKSDAQVDEMLTAFGGLQGALATAAKTRRETSLLGNEAAPDYAAVAGQLETLAGDLQGQIQAAQAANVLTKGERQLLSAVAAISTSSAARLRSPTADSQLPAIVLDLKNAGKSWDGGVADASAATAGPEPAIRRQLAALRRQLKAAIEALGPKPDEPPAFTLYEIQMTAAGTTLVEVKF